MARPGGLGRLPEFDERSRRFNVAHVLRGLPVRRGRSWQCPVVLDQGQTSACTGFSRAHDLLASPAPAKGVDGSIAYDLYLRARRLDEFPGEDYDGSSVLGALKAARELGYVGEYRWAFSMEDMILAVCELGPVVVGTDWLASMDEPSPSGLLTVDPSSGVVGGHAYMVRGVIFEDSHKRRIAKGMGVMRPGVPLLRIRNSWSERWGVGGDAFMWADDYEKHLFPGGEQSVVTSALRR